MSDPMSQMPNQPSQPMPGGAPMGRGGPAPSPVGDAIEQNRSIFNSADVASLAGNKQITPETTVRDFLGFFGIDVEGPVTQLIDFQKNQIEKADPMKKMAAIAGAGKPAPESPAPTPMSQNRFPQGAKASVAPGLQGLVTQMGA